MDFVSKASRSVSGVLLGAFLCLCVLASCIPTASAGRALAQHTTGQPFTDGAEIFTTISIDVPPITSHPTGTYHPTFGSGVREECSIPSVGTISNCKVHSTWLNVESGFKFESTDDVDCCDDTNGFATIYEQKHVFARGWGVEAVFEWGGSNPGSVTAPLLTTTGVTTSTEFGGAQPRVRVVLSPPLSEF